MENHNKPIFTHEYDLDAIAAYFRLSELEFTPENIIHKVLYLERIKKEVETFCTNSDLNFSFFFENKIPMIIPSTTPNFELYVGLYLISYDIPKIGAFLSYQKSIYKGENNFVNLVEFLIYRIVKNNSPLDNTVRLEKIMQWVLHERSFEKLIETDSKKSLSESEDKHQEEKQYGSSTLRHALFHFYLQEAKYEPFFKSSSKQSKKAAMKEQGQKYGVSGNNFMNHFYSISKRRNRVLEKNIQHLKIVIEMLSLYPEAKVLAEKELNEVS